MSRHTFISILLVIFVSGCALGPLPQNAEEQRNFVRKAGFGSAFETYVVNRPYYKVVKTLKANTRKCLNKKVKFTSCGGSTPGCNVRFRTYNPSFIQGRKKSELHVQVVESHSIDLAGKAPKGGLHVAVIDFIKVGKKKTKINVYTMGGRNYRDIPQAVKHWAKATNLGCPDLTQRGLF